MTKAAVTVENTTARYFELYDKALALRTSPSALNVAKSCLDSIARLHGLIVDRKAVTAEIDIRALLANLK